MKKKNSSRSPAVEVPRLKKLTLRFRSLIGGRPTHAFSAPGRTELGGNHTDHNNGKVLAASVEMDALAVVHPRSDGLIRIVSEGFKDTIEVRTDLLAPQDGERNTSAALVRGVAACLKQQGHAIGGFDAVVTSRVGIGSGLSSSASFEVLVGSIFNTLYNDDRMKVLEIALAGQYAENTYFGKPCGLMDQLACSVGGTIKIDFRQPTRPRVERLEFDPRRFGYELVVVSTGSSHEDLTEEYASVPAEMKSVAQFFGKETCRDISAAIVLKNLKAVRSKCGDRAVLRSLHFFEENERVEREFKALKTGKFVRFLELVRSSGDSSMKYVQNIYSTKTPREQTMTTALALADRFLGEEGKGACRIHGGGFAGTIQAYVPFDAVGRFRTTMDGAFGRGSCVPLRVRQMGVGSFPLP